MSSKLVAFLYQLIDIMANTGGISGWTLQRELGVEDALRFLLAERGVPVPVPKRGLEDALPFLLVQRGVLVVEEALFDLRAMDEGVELAVLRAEVPERDGVEVALFNLRNGVRTAAIFPSSKDGVLLREEAREPFEALYK